jgi:GAF domain-containing protein
MLQEPSRLLESIAKATHVLLTLENFEEAIHAALQIIGEGVGADRIKVLESNFDGSFRVPTFHTVIYEWTTPGIIRQMEHFANRRINSEGIEAFLEQYFFYGNGFGGLLEEWHEPLRSTLATTQVQSAYSTPIRVKGQWWGVLCVDYCQTATQLAPPEVAILTIIADCIGSAIQRDRSSREREEFAQRRVAELSKAHQALKQTIDTLATEPELDHFLKHVLRVIAEQFDAPLIQYWEHPEPGDVAYLRLAYDHGEIFTVDQLPENCFVTGIQIPPELIDNEDLHTRQRHYVVEDVPTDPIQQSIFAPLNFDLEAWCTECGIRKLINMPLTQAGKTTGALLLYFPSDRHLGEQQIELAYALAQQVTLAIQVTQLAETKQAEAVVREQEKTAQARAAELSKANTAMRRSIDRLARDPDMNAVLSHVLRAIINQFDADVAQLFLYDAQDHTLQTSVGILDNEIIVSPPYNPKFSAATWLGWDVLLRSPTPRVLNLETEPELFLSDYLEFHQNRNHRGIVCALLVQDEQPIGFIGFACSQRATFSQNDLELV